MGESASLDVLKKVAQRKMLEFLSSNLPSGESQAGKDAYRIIADLKRGEEKGEVEPQFWRELGNVSDETLGLVEGALNSFLRCYQAYPAGFVLPYERLRNFVQKKRTGQNPGLDQKRIRVQFWLVVHGLQLIDPTNLIFELQGEASVGLLLEDAAEYLKVQAIDSQGYKAIGASMSLDGVLLFDAADDEKKLRALLQIRMRGGKLDLSYSYFRYGIATGVVWLIQEFTARIYLRADFEHMPFDGFDVEADFNVGMGGDIVNVGLVVDEDTSTLFSKDFDAGEFKAATKTATLVPIGYLHDTSHFVDNVVRLNLKVWRNPRKMLLRIGLPLLTIVSVMLAASWLASPSDAASMITGLLLAIVGLQLTAAQGMPRDAEFSVMDRCFVSSYLLAALLFVLLLSCPQSSLRIAVTISGVLYVLGLSTFLTYAWRKWWRKGPGAGASHEQQPLEG